MRLQVVADQAGSKHTGDSRNRGKGGQPVWPVTTPDRRGVEMRTFGDEHVTRESQAETAFVLARIWADRDGVAAYVLRT